MARGEMKIKRQTHMDEVGRLSISQSKGVYKPKTEQEQNICKQQQPIHTVFLGGIVFDHYFHNTPQNN